MDQLTVGALSRPLLRSVAARVRRFGEPRHELLGSHPGAGVDHRQPAHPATRSVEPRPVDIPHHRLLVSAPWRLASNGLRGTDHPPGGRAVAGSNPVSPTIKALLIGGSLAVTAGRSAAKGDKRATNVGCPCRIADGTGLAIPSPERPRTADPLAFSTRRLRRGLSTRSLGERNPFCPSHAAHCWPRRAWLVSAGEDGCVARSARAAS